MAASPSGWSSRPVRVLGGQLGRVGGRGQRDRVGAAASLPDRSDGGPAASVRSVAGHGSSLRDDPVRLRCPGPVEQAQVEVAAEASRPARRTPSVVMLTAASENISELTGRTPGDLARRRRSGPRRSAGRTGPAAARPARRTRSVPRSGTRSARSRSGLGSASQRTGDPPMRALRSAATCGGVRYPAPRAGDGSRGCGHGLDLRPRAGWAVAQHLRGACRASGASSRSGWTCRAVTTGARPCGHRSPASSGRLAAPPR